MLSIITLWLVNRFCINAFNYSAATFTVELIRHSLFYKETASAAHTAACELGLGKSVIRKEWLTDKEHEHMHL